ncbi:hypothetical protein [Corynebacterium ciconiae]|nr:hypothetical protein [Corynebacterium ciconiae]
MAVPAAHADSTPMVTVSTAAREGGEVTIGGSGFATSGPGIYVAIAPSTVPGFYGHSDSFVGADPNKDFMEAGSTWWVYPAAMASMASSMPSTAPMGEDGSFRVQLSVPAYDGDTEYVVLTTKGHGQGRSDTSQDTRTPVC